MKTPNPDVVPPSAPPPPCSNSKMQQRQCQYTAAEYLRTCFAFGYFFCVLPYKFVRLRTGKYEFEVKSSLPHKIVFIIIHIVNCYRLITLIYWFQINPADPTTYFARVTLFTGFVYKTVFPISIWRQRDSFLSVLNQVYKYGGEFARWGRAFAIGLCTLSLLLAITGTIVGSGILSTADWTPTTYVQKHAALATRLFMFPDDGGGGVAPN